MARLPFGIGDFIASFKGDTPGHPFRGNQYDGGSDNELSNADYPDKIDDYFNSNYSPSFTVPEAKPGDTKEKVKDVARNLVSHAVSDAVGGSAFASRKDHADFIEGWARRALKGDPFSIEKTQSSGSKYEIKIRRIRKRVNENG